MNLAAYVPLAGFFINVIFALFVFSRRPRSPANRVYLLLGLSIAVWNLGSYHLFVVEDHDTALFWARFLQFGCIFGVVAFFHLSLIVAGYSLWRWVRWLYVFEIGLALTNLTPLFIADVRDRGDAGWYAVAGPAFHVFNLPFSLMFGSIVVLVMKIRTLPRMQRNRLKPLILAQTLLSVLGANDVLPIMGIEHYPFTQIPIYPWGSVAAVFYGIIVAYAVMQHDLLDIRVGFSRYAAHLVRFTLLFSITVALLLSVNLFTSAFTPASFIAALLVFLASSIFASLLFPRLFGGSGIDRFERRILGDHFEYQDRVRIFTENVVWQNDIDTIFAELDDLFVGAFKFDRYWTVMRDNLDRAFVLAHAHPKAARTVVPEMKVPSPVFTHFEDPKNEILDLGHSRVVRSGSPLERDARGQLARFDAEIALPLRWEGELFGLILIGPKMDEEPMTMTDLRLLIELTRRLSLVLNQIWLKEEIFRTQELELLGRMSRGMAHDLNNLLTPIGTLLQLANEGATHEAMDEQLVAIALQNVHAVNAYIKEALFFSQNLRPDFQLGRLDALVQQAVELALINRRREVDVVADVSEEIHVEMDAVLIQRLLGNLISNAIDASPAGTVITVEASRAGKTGASRDWLRLRVIDQGEGIPEENLKRVSAPYFTTKNRGDSRGGFGLGLAISRKIVALHGGVLTLSSRPQSGTTVQIDLPSRQNKPVIQSVAHAP